jgi:thiol-disulfide isomerase/thioredoxin
VIRPLLISCAFLALASCNKAPQHNQQQGATNEVEQVPGVPVKGVDRSHKGTPAPNITLDDGMAFDADMRSDMRNTSGTPTLVNLWATWCAPCVKELPTIDRLAKEHYALGDLGVMAISQDSAPHASVEAFLKRLNIKEVGTFQDSKMALSGALGADVLPTTILYDAKGREIWRYVGDLDWTSPEAAKLLAEGGVGRKG